MKRLFLILNVLPRLGFLSLWRIACYKIGLKSGYYRLNLPIKKFTAPAAGIFHAGAVSRKKFEDDPALIEKAATLLKGELLMFSHWPYHFEGCPAWHLDPIHQLSCSQNQHWTQTEVPAGSDIKCFWELSRFEWAPLLARAWCETGDRKYIEVLNKFMLDWMAHNPLNQGVNWKCGQESSIRLINLLLTWWLLGKGRGDELAPIVFAHLSRVSATLGYALSQNNNHGTSEGAGLFIGGAWLAHYGVDETQRKFGRKCSKKGRYWLEDRIDELIFADGGFSQYSTSYHRTLLDTLSQVEFWRLELKLPEFSSNFCDRTRSAIEWLLSLVNPATGAVPNLGANDGAKLYTPSESSHTDFRPSLQLLSVLVNREKLFDDPVCDEPIRCLGLDDALSVKNHSHRSIVHLQFGAAVLRNDDLLAVVRFANFKFRPSQADCLHLDVFHKDKYVLRDGGSCSYHEPELHKYFSGTEAHNTIQFDDHDQMPRLGRFLFSNWLKMNLVSGVYSEDPYQCWKGAYSDCWGNQHERKVRLREHELIVIDTIGGDFSHATLRWRLMPGVWQLEGAKVQSAAASISVGARNCPIRCEITPGWESRLYLQKEQIPVFHVHLPPGPNEITTTISFH